MPLRFPNMIWSEPQLEAWNVSENDFPKTGDASEKLRFILKYAVLAPSGHNTQPWIFRINQNNTVELYADRTRALAVVDPDDRELVISCGAALFHLQLAIRHFGYTDMTELFPHSEDKDLLARVKLKENKPEHHQQKPKEQEEQEEDSLFQAITQRRSNRMAFQQKEVQEHLLYSLKDIANDYQAWFDIIVKEEDDSGKMKNAVADLISEGDRIQWSDKRFRRELASWIHSNRSQSRDGMPGYAHGISDIPSVMASFAIRTFDDGKGQAAKDRQLASGSPVLAVLGTDKDDPVSWLQAGQALAKILLRARAEDVWTSFLNQPIEVAELRSKLCNILGRVTGFPQILMRMGYGQEIKPTPRRTVDEVVH